MAIKDLSGWHRLGGSLSLSENDTCFEYSENVEALKKLMSEITVSVNVVGKDKYFDDDKDDRLILRVIILRGKKEISFRFGMSIADTLYLTINQSSTKQEALEYLKMRFPFKKRFVVYDFEFNMAHERFLKEKHKEIKDNLLYSLLSCIASEFSCPDKFKDFCSDFDYDEDSRKAEKTFYNCKEQAEKLHTIFTDEEIECLPR